MQKLKKRLLRLLLILIPLYFLLMIPDARKPAAGRPVQAPFAWNQDSMWLEMEKNFAAARKQPASLVDSGISTLFMQQQMLNGFLALPALAASDAVFSKILANYFQLAAVVAARPKERDSFIGIYSHTREIIKEHSQHWNMNDPAVRNVLYRVLYGMRAAAEEVLLQTSGVPFNTAIAGKNEPAVSPAANILGIEVHSGDMLVSRGGAEVSALISRGNNYPGNFSHVALLYVNEENNQPYLIEAHIEKGVAIATAEQYIKDKKLRFTVLRLRTDLPALKADPLLPHKAAALAYQQATATHIPYDFKMNFHDSTALFCSEVASHAYQLKGIRLWQASSTISSQGVINWLSDFGVENFVTQMPSDLEYDPQLSVVAEWRDPATLMKDHVDNAVMDALLEEADKGKTIGYNSWQLPFVRIIKGYCVIKNYFGGVGIIPEGMSATKALKNQTFVAMYKKVKQETELRISEFTKANGYKPPYWQMVALAKKATLNLKP